MRSLSDELFARPPWAKIFVSSRMHGGLDDERVAVAEAIEGTGFARAWYWERDAYAGPYSSESVCLGHARTSDGLVLLLARELSRVTRLEYEAAREYGVPCYILLKDAVERDEEVLAFIERERAHAITVGFRNISELRTQVTGALVHHAVQSIRRDIVRRRSRNPKRGRLGRVG